MLRRIWSLSIKEFIHLRNDWFLPAFMLFGGVLELVVIAWATSRPIVNFPLIVLDHDRTVASRSLVESLENTGTFAPAIWATTMDEVQVSMDRGRVNAAVVVPPGFQREMKSAVGRPELPIILNGAESIPARAALQAIEGVAGDLETRITLDRIGLDPDDLGSFDFSLRVWFNEALVEAVYTTPAELALMLEFTVLLFAALAFSRERELGTLEQLLVMPYSSLEIIIGKSIPVLIIGMTDFILMLGVVHTLFDVPIRGSLALILIFAFGYLMVELGKGMVISVISKTQHQAFLLVLLIGMVDFLFTGYAAPVESMPQVLQWVANIIPAHHWLVILRGLMIKVPGLKSSCPIYLPWPRWGLSLSHFPCGLSGGLWIDSMIDIQTSTSPAIVSRGLEKQFGDFTAVNGVDFEVHFGEIFGFLGPNGSGKTTTIRMMLGLLQPSAGSVELLGSPVKGLSRDVRLRIGYMSQKFSLYNDLTVRQNLEFYGAAYGLKGGALQARIAEILALADLVGREDTPTKDLSGGWRQRRGGVRLADISDPHRRCGPGIQAGVLGAALPAGPG